MATSSMTGRAGSISLNSVTIPITEWTCRGIKDMADATDSGNYDTGTGQLYKSQLPGAIALEGSIKGNFDTATTNTNIVAKLKADPTLPLSLKLNTTTTYASGSFDLTDVECTLSVPGATMVNFTANFKSNGIFTLGA